ncbi:MAG: ATP synthase F1 subunit gamma [Bacteroidetes bacterium HGW-Bacteroidetes-6]|jgi:F-type H+-transporting ATPase subunit gamma|nr:MAG: ATP synthase F1 subunit gamma [Bacteroidetes bacterium HGW-Bacteroidetes-6]
MPNLKEVRNRIQSVTTTKQITSAMKLVSASKLRRAQDSILRFRPYASKLREIMLRVAAGVDDLPNDGVFAKRPVKRVLMVVFSANRGLCGVFNANISKQVMTLLQEKYAEAFAAGLVDFISFGKKVPDALKKRGVVFAREFNHLIEKPGFDEISEIGNTIINEFIEGKHDEIVLVYNQFKNAAVQAPVNEIFLPFNFASDAEETGDYILEPEREKMFEMLVPKTLRIQLYKALLDSIASEHGARMTSMHKATDNATEILKDLRLSYNKARQAAITNEIIEIVSGAEALNG